jgi:hypothetical protein
MKFFIPLIIFLINFGAFQTIQAQNNRLFEKKQKHFGIKQQKSFFQKKNNESAFRIALITENWQSDQFSSYSVGLQFELYLNENISIATQLDMGPLEQQTGFYGHLSWGMWLAGYPLTLASRNGGNNEGLVFFALLLAIMPETIYFHIPVTNQLVISPFVTPVAMHYLGTIKAKTTYEQFIPALSVGVRTNISLNRNWEISPNISWRTAYDTSKFPKGVVFGIQIGGFL